LWQTKLAKSAAFFSLKVSVLIFGDIEQQFFYKHCALVTFFRGKFFLVKFAPGANFNNILQATFAAVDHKVQKDTDDLTVFLHFWDLCL